MPRKSWQEKRDEFFKTNEEFLIPAKENSTEDSPYKYLWDDFPAVKKKLNEFDDKEPGLYCYTLVEDDGNAYITSNWHFVNRIGYFISNKKVDPNINIRYW